MPIGHGQPVGLAHCGTWRDDRPAHGQRVRPTAASGVRSGATPNPGRAGPTRARPAPRGGPTVRTHSTSEPCLGRPSPLGPPRKSCVRGCESLIKPVVRKMAARSSCVVQSAVSRWPGRSVPSWMTRHHAFCVMTAHTPSGEPRPMNVEVSISIRTILLVAGAVAIAWALASIANVLLVIFVSVFSVAVLSPVVTGDGAAVGLEPGAVLDGARAGDRDRHRRGRAGAGAGDRAARCAGSATTCRRSSTSVRHSDLGNVHQRRERLARHVEAARERHRRRGGQGVGRRRPCRSLGLRGGHARLLGHLPDALRAGRRTARAGLDRGPAVSGQAGALPAGHGSDHPDDLALHARQPGHLRDLRDRLRRHRADPRRFRTRSRSR